MGKPLLRWRIPKTLRVEGRSMEPAYTAGQVIRISRLRGASGPSRGHVVVFRSPSAPERLDLKRVIGVPHDHVGWRAGRFRINGVWLDEPYARIRPAPPGDDQLLQCQLDADEYVVAGDNRLYSEDSRRYGPIKRAEILGRVNA